MEVLDLNFQFLGQEPSFVVCLKAGDDKAEDNFDLNLEPDSQLAIKIHDIDAGSCEDADLNFVGTELAIALMPGKIGELFNTLRDADKKRLFHLRLSLPPQFQNVPWESLYTRKIGFLSRHQDYCVLRAPPPEAEFPPFEPGPPKQLAVLAVIPEGSQLNIDHEWQNLKQAVSRGSDSPQLDKLTGRVTPDALADKLHEKPWDIVHYIGHGELNEDGSATIRLQNDEGKETWISAETFASLFTGRAVRLVVLNCCLGASACPTRSLSGLGPFLMREGIPAVVAMRYEIPDDVAIKFSQSFYKELLQGQKPGRVDIAIDEARDVVFRNRRDSTVRGFVTPVLYLAKGYEQLFTVAAIRDSVPPPRLPPPQPRRHSLPKDLVAAIKERRCIPVIGPGVLSVGALRSTPPPPGPRELADLLDGDLKTPDAEKNRSEEEAYPDRVDFEVCDQAGDWMSMELLQWVCCHYQHVRRRYQLVRRIHMAYEKCEPSDLVRGLAKWNVPEMFYTYFDGLLERLVDVDKATSVLHSVDQKVALNTDKSYEKARLVVLIRGSLANDKSLVLTEEDYYDLWDRIPRMDPQLVDLATGVSGRSLLFFGLNPREPLVRRLGKQLLETGNNENQGPTFFACAKPAKQDVYYWSRYDVTWLNQELGALVQEVLEVGQ